MFELLKQIQATHSYFVKLQVDLMMKVNLDVIKSTR